MPEKTQKDKFWKKWEVKLFQGVSINGVIVEKVPIASPKDIQEIAWKFIEKSKLNLDLIDLTEDFEITTKGNYILSFVKK